MVQPNQNQPFNKGYFLQLPSFEKHRYTESLLGEKIKMTYNEAINILFECSKKDEKIDASIRNLIEFKNKILVDDTISDKDCLLFAGIDKFSGILHLVIKNQDSGHRKNFSFYEINSAEQISHIGDAFDESSFQHLKKCEVKNDLNEKKLNDIGFQAPIQQIFSSSIFSNTKKNSTLDEISLRYPQWIDEIKKNNPQIIHIYESFKSIHAISDKLDYSSYTPPTDIEPFGVILSSFNVGHSRIDLQDIEGELLTDSKRRHTKSSAKVLT